MHLARLITAVIVSTGALPGALAGAPVPTPTAPGWREATARIDRELTAAWARAGVTAAPDASDAEFLRRVTLDIAGRIPTPGETSHFLADRSPAKREVLVDRLLASADYARHWSTLYLDELVGREVRLRPRYPSASVEWFEAAFRERRPLDRMAQELIAARGGLGQNGAVGYLVGNRMRGGSLESLAGNTARFFLGLQIQCAQCHDHPYDKRWKQEHFTAFAAWFAEVRIQRGDPRDPSTIVVDDRPIGPAARPKARLPLRRVAPRFLGREVPPLAGEVRRQTLARAVVGSPLFARAAVNRTWDRLLGRGLLDPWDDLGAEDDARQPEALRMLADDHARAGHDHAWLVKVIVMSKAYGRSSTGGTAPPGAAPHALETVFARAAVRPLTADQLFRSQLLATGIEAAAGQRMGHWKLEQRKRQALRQYLFTFDDDEGGESDAFTGSIPQALLLRNGDLTNGGARAMPGMVLGRIMKASPDPAQRLDWLFLSTYARPATAEEKRPLLAHLAAHAQRPEAYEDVFHALLTSTEFVTNH